MSAKQDLFPNKATLTLLV